MKMTLMINGDLGMDIKRLKIVQEIFHSSLVGLLFTSLRYAKRIGNPVSRCP